MTIRRYRQLTLFPLLLVLVLALLPARVVNAASDPGIIGHVKVTSGTALIISDGVSTPARPGSAVRAHDTLITGSTGSMGVTFRDDTRISLGPTSAMLMKDFAFDPLKDDNVFIARLNKGSLLYESHVQRKLASLETPDATIGIRGTRFLIRVVE